MRFYEYVEAQRRNLDAVLHFEFFAATCAHMEALYELSIKLISKMAEFPRQRILRFFGCVNAVTGGNLEDLWEVRRAHEPAPPPDACAQPPALPDPSRPTFVAAFSAVDTLNSCP
jgi:hypothetical protein